MEGLDWIAADWGTSHLRVWLMRADGTVLDRRSSTDGMGGLARAGFEPALRALLPELPKGARVPAVICGMAGSRQGWIEAPYVAVPAPPPKGDSAATPGVSRDDLAVFILPGMKQAQPADVMRGEETQVAGFMALNPRFDGVICLPGTHSKWVHVSAGEVVSFRTFLTGEVFALLAGQSVLRHSVAGEGWDRAAFAAGVERGLARPAAVAGDLFSLRAEALLEGLDPVVARSRLSGLLIGMELGAARPYWLGQNLAVLGARGIAGAYRDALEAQGLPVLVADADRMTLEGLKAAYASLTVQA